MRTTTVACPVCETFTLEVPPFLSVHRTTLLILEKKLETHIKEHTVVELVQRITRLQAELKALKATFP